DPEQLLRSTDGRNWGPVGRAPNDARFTKMNALGDGTIIADVIDHRGHVLVRSGDAGVTWTEALVLGSYRMLTRHSIVELNGTVFFLEYQTFTDDSTPIRLWASTYRGRSWNVRRTFTGHRHGHGMVADPERNALWVFMGDTTPQSATLRSTDGGFTWTTMVAGQEGNIVDAILLDDGSILFGHDISYLPSRPHIATIAPDGTYREIM